jgi:hypothetical protein
MNLDAVKAKLMLDKGLMQAADDGLRAKLLLDRAALKELGDNVLDRMPDLPFVRRTPKPRNVFQAVQFKVWNIEDQVYDAAERALPTWRWLQRSWADRPWRASARRLPNVGFGHLAALLMGAAFGALAVYMVNTRMGQNGTDSAVDEAMRQTEEAIGSRWNRSANPRDASNMMNSEMPGTSQVGPGRGSSNASSSSAQSGGWNASRGSGSSTGVSGTARRGGSGQGDTGSIMVQTGRPDEALGAAGEKDIPRNEWEQFCENFTRQHDRATLTVERGQETVVSDQPLIALSFENSDGRPDFRIVVGDLTGENFAHVVADVTRVQMLTRGGGADEGLRFHNADGQTTLRLRK